VTILGPRQSGKTTLVRKMFPNYAYVNLEQPDVRQLAELDPQAFLMRFAFPVIMDEIQRVPALLSYIQVIVDEKPILLKASFIVFYLPPYFENFGKRLIKSPKVFFTKPGLAAWLLGIREASQAGNSPYLGGLFENMVVVEALKARYNKGEESNLYFWRDNNGLEADLLVSAHDSLTPVEIKASMTFSADFMKSFARLKRASDKIKAGYVIYAGDLEAAILDDHFINFNNTASVKGL